MIESLISLLAIFGFDGGETEDPKSAALAPQHQPEMIRAIDSLELQGFENLEVQTADEWFV